MSRPGRTCANCRLPLVRGCGRCSVHSGCSVRKFRSARCLRRAACSQGASRVLTAVRFKPRSEAGAARGRPCCPRQAQCRRSGLSTRVNTPSSRETTRSSRPAQCRPALRQTSGPKLREQVCQGLVDCTSKRARTRCCTLKARATSCMNAIARRGGTGGGSAALARTWRTSELADKNTNARAV